MESAVKVIAFPNESIARRQVFALKPKNSALKVLLSLVLLMLGFAFNSSAQFRIEANNNTGCTYVVKAFDATSTLISQNTTGAGVYSILIDDCTNTVSFITIQDSNGGPPTCTLLTFGAAGIFPSTTQNPFCICSASINCAGVTQNAFGFGSYMLITLNIN